MPWLPGTTGTPSRIAVLIAFDLLPIVSMEETGGPTKLIAWERTSSANWLLSDRKPMPGCSASTCSCSAMESTDSAFR